MTLTQAQHRIAACLWTVLCLAIVAVLLAGCGLFEHQVEYVPYPVKVKVEVPCAAQLPAEPAWKTKALKKADEIDTKVDAVMAERQQRLGYEEQLKSAVKGCQ